MLNLLFLLGEKKHFYSGEELLINVLDRLSVFHSAYTIEYCYQHSPPSRSKERNVVWLERRNQFLGDWKNSETVVVAAGWMAVELLTGFSKTRTSQFIGIRKTIPPLQYDVWFTFDPAAALFDPNLYVDIMGSVSAAVRYAGRQIIINTSVKPYQWDNL
jgi:hypothetical protein